MCLYQTQDQLSSSPHTSHNQQSKTAQLLGERLVYARYIVLLPKYSRNLRKGGIGRFVERALVPAVSAEFAPVAQQRRQFVAGFL